MPRKTKTKSTNTTRKNKKAIIPQEQNKKKYKRIRPPVHVTREGGDEGILGQIELDEDIANTTLIEGDEEGEREGDRMGWEERREEEGESCGGGGRGKREKSKEEWREKEEENEGK